MIQKFAYPSVQALWPPLHESLAEDKTWVCFSPFSCVKPKQIKMYNLSFVCLVWLSFELGALDSPWNTPIIFPVPVPCRPMGKEMHSHSLWVRTVVPQEVALQPVSYNFYYFFFSRYKLLLESLLNKTPKDHSDFEKLQGMTSTWTGLYSIVLNTCRSIYVRY